ncbi:hypothetical protein [Halosegnis sp.]|uniref:hypothetical protein n=1 Tax=Halosegnis sp. TaxID=2864959 RepID=UPI0035D410B5
MSLSPDTETLRRVARLRRVIADLQAHETPDERLVTVTVPPETPVHEIAGRLTREYAAAADINTSTTQTAVREALAALRDHLREYDTVPVNGLVLAAGVLDEARVWTLDVLPASVPSLRVERDQRFRIDPLLAMCPDPTPERDAALLADLFARRNGDGTAVAGFRPTRRELTVGAVEQLLISERLVADVAVYDCPEGHETHTLIASDEPTPDRDCPVCGAVANGERAEPAEAVTHLLALADRHGGDPTLVTPAADCGERFHAAFDGVGALLRYPTGE